MEIDTFKYFKIHRYVTPAKHLLQNLIKSKQQTWFFFEFDSFVQLIVLALILNDLKHAPFFTELFLNQIRKLWEIPSSQ